MLKTTGRSLAALSLMAALFWAAVPTPASAIETVATLERIEGTVSVELEDGKSASGRNGQLLNAGDKVVTSRSGQATIKFRDGSEIRVLPNTDFKVDLVQEKGKSARAFQYKLSMKLGSVWGNFIKQKHAASVTTTTATIGIKGTTLRVVERDGKARVALTEGEVEVKNTRHKATLTPGKRLSDFGPTDDLPKKVEDIPFKLDVKTDVKKLVWEDSRNAQAYVTLQLVDVKRAGNMARSGSVYLRSNYDKVVYPGQVNLNERGFARVQLEFPKPDGSDSQLAGNIYVWAVMAGEKDDDVGEGKVLFTYDPPPTTKKIQVRADTGETKQVK